MPTRSARSGSTGARRSGRCARCAAPATRTTCRCSRAPRCPSRSRTRDLPPMPPGEHVVEDYRHLHLSLKAHPVSFLRRRLRTRAASCRMSALPTIANGRRVTVAGLVLVRQRPGTAKGVIFMTLEDETGIANTIVWPRTFETFRPVVLGARLVSVTGNAAERARRDPCGGRADRGPDAAAAPPVGRRTAASTRCAPTDEVRRPVIERHRASACCGNSLVTLLKEGP